MAKDPSYSSTPERSVEEDQGYLVPNWDQRGIMDEGYAIQQNFDDASKYVDNDLQSFLQGTTRFSMSSIAPGGTYEFGSGSLSAPGIRWAADTDSGFYLPAAGQMDAVIGGVAITNWTASGFAIPAITAGSVLFAGTSGLVSQDNTNFFFDDTTNLLKIGGLTASRLTMTDANKYLASVTTLSDFIIGTTNQISVTNDGNGGVVLATPQNIHTAADVTFNTITVNGLTLSGFTDTRVLFAGPGGAITEDAGFTFNSTTNAVTITGAFTLNGHQLWTSDNTYDLGASGVTRPRTIYAGTSFNLPTTGTYSWDTDLLLVRDAAAWLGQRNGTNAQRYNIYRSYTDASNYERLTIGQDSNYSTSYQVLFSQSAGTGTSYPLAIGCRGASAIHFVTSDSQRWQVASGGGFLCTTDNSLDIGASGATRPRTIYPGTSIVFPTGGTLSWSTDLHLRRGAASSLQISDGTTGQNIKVYGTTSSDTTPANYGRLNISSNNAGASFVVTEVSGSVTSQSLTIGTNVNADLYISINSAARWTFGLTSYAFYPNADNAYSIGGGGNRVASGYFGTSVVVGATTHTITATGVVFNETGIDQDFRIEGDNKTSNLLLDASDDEVAIDGRFSLIDSTPAQITADQNDYVGAEGTATSRSTVWRISSDAARNITGIGNPLQGRVLTLINVGAQNIVIQNQNVGSTAANRIVTGTAADITMAPDDTMLLWYDGTSSRWRVLA